MFSMMCYYKSTFTLLSYSNCALGQTVIASAFFSLAAHSDGTISTINLLPYTHSKQTNKVTTSELGKLLHPKRSRMMPPPGNQIYLWPRVTLTFGLLMPKVDHFVPLLCGPLVPICIKIHSVVFKILCSQVW